MKDLTTLRNTLGQIRKEHTNKVHTTQINTSPPPFHLSQTPGSFYMENKSSLDLTTITAHDCSQTANIENKETKNRISILIDNTGAPPLLWLYR